MVFSHDQKFNLHLVQKLKVQLYKIFAHILLAFSQHGRLLRKNSNYIQCRAISTLSTYPNCSNTLIFQEESLFIFFPSRSSKEMFHNIVLHILPLTLES